VRRFGRSNGLRFFAPPALVIVTAVALLSSVLQLAGVLRGAAALIASAIYLPLIAYAVLVIGVGLVSPGGVRQRLWTMAVLPTMHSSWGLGFIGGALRGARDTVDASRLGSRNTPLP
jgi:hypothetical protein